jgi:transposase-like protein
MKQNDKIQIKALSDSGTSIADIARQVKIKYDTVWKFVHNYRLNKDLPEV